MCTFTDMSYVSYCYSIMKKFDNDFFYFYNNTRAKNWFNSCFVCVNKWFLIKYIGDYITAHISNIIVSRVNGMMYIPICILQTQNSHIYICYYKKMNIEVGMRINLLISKSCSLSFSVQFILSRSLQMVLRK